MSFDSTGKASFDHVYTEPDPRPYFRTLGGFDYLMPQVAKPYVAQLIEEHEARTVLDIGCSYGVNAALYRCDTTMERLYTHYAAAEGLDRGELLARDRALPRARDVRFVGLDSSAPALEYAHTAGFLDEAVHANLEHDDPTARQRAVLAEADLVISTGCVGYVTERTIARVAGRRRPPMAHFVLRMFSYEPIAASLAGLGYRTVGVDGVFRQRRFASRAEREQLLAAVRATGVEPHALEIEGWLCAQLYLSRPTEGPS